jgi:hypothetical protein
VSKHTLKLVFKAIGPDDYFDGGLVTSNSKQAIDGAQLLVCAHAHYFSTGRIPENVMPQTADFVFRNPSVHGGELKFTLEILRPGIWCSPHSDFSSFLNQSYRCWVAGRLFDEPPGARRQLDLRDLQSGNAPAMTQQLQLEQLSRLYSRIDRAIADLTRPIGLSASSLSLCWNGKLLGSHEGRHKRFTDQEITQAVAALNIRRRIPKNFKQS